MTDDICFWPDYESPWDWDDPPVCRRPAVYIVTFRGAQKGMPTCESCAEWMMRDYSDQITVEKIRRS